MDNEIQGVNMDVAFEQLITQVLMFVGVGTLVVLIFLGLLVTAARTLLKDKF